MLPPRFHHPQKSGQRLHAKFDTTHFAPMLRGGAAALSRRHVDHFRRIGQGFSGEPRGVAFPGGQVPAHGWRSWKPILRARIQNLPSWDKALNFLLKSFAILLIRMYQALHTSFFTGVCRFEPSCSHYAVEAIEKRGLGMGVLLTAWRIARCQPFCKGGFDPVPEAPARQERGSAGSCSGCGCLSTSAPSPSQLTPRRFS
jgi:uncharacterized protein